ncbi:MAG: hypothetical protein ACRDGV_09875, partial [Candidatus Limnocylindria bacterium]
MASERPGDEGLTILIDSPTDDEEDTQGHADVRFLDPKDEKRLAQLIARRRKEGRSVEIRVRPAAEADTEGHLALRGDLAVAGVLVVDDDDTAGHAISIHFPSKEEARKFQVRLMAGGAMALTVATAGIGAGIVLAPQAERAESAAISAPAGDAAMTAQREAGAASVGAGAAT